MYELGSITWRDQYDGTYLGYGLLKEHYYLKSNQKSNKFNNYDCLLNEE